ncbi:sialate O-acetylesterase [uncultured Winogradskyella sp.]|uniref:sialate O-acetylesterase n=1 Tax=uncultured Winogradskyella sp. TaxID=395353 RepID=UPI00261C143E|nr:sialate O-acetylesterase [uncultured Winogradskyella sp.]
MVLQQKDDVAIWGNDKPNTVVHIETDWGIIDSTKSDNKGNWKIEIKTPIASYKNYSINISGSSTIALKNVLIGEVWFCSGQSNMEMTMRGYSNSPIRGSNEFILNSENKNIRLFKAKRQASLNPLDNVVGDWNEATPSAVYNFSAVGYLFAKKMQKILQIPIGIISSSWGGTKIKGWSSKEALEKYDFITFPTELPEKGKKERETPTLLYNGMIHPFLGYNIKGILWYQGETDRFEYENYKELFPNMVNSWRREWNLEKEIPFYYVQIAPYDYATRDKTDKPNSALIREIQMQSLSKINNAGMVVTADVGDCENIHPSEKKTVATRLAYLALKNNYGFTQIGAQSPIYKEMKIVGEFIEIIFDDETAKSGNGLSSNQKELSGFLIAGEDKIFHPATVIITKDRTLKVFSEKVKFPIAVRYGFDNCFKASLFNTTNLPVSPFRTDQWEIKD